MDFSKLDDTTLIDVAYNLQLISNRDYKKFNRIHTLKLLSNIVNNEKHVEQCIELLKEKRKEVRETNKKQCGNESTLLGSDVLEMRDSSLFFHKVNDTLYSCLDLDDVKYTLETKKNGGHYDPFTFTLLNKKQLELMQNWYDENIKRDRTNDVLSEAFENSFKKTSTTAPIDEVKKQILEKQDIIQKIMVDHHEPYVIVANLSEVSLDYLIIFVDSYPFGKSLSTDLNIDILSDDASVKIKLYCIF
jgi:hypothetical protein